MNPFAPLADRDFRLYFTGEVFSSAGSGLHIVAFGWYLLDRTGSATSVALVWAIGLGSGIVVLPFTGPLADRYRRLRRRRSGASLLRRTTRSRRSTGAASRRRGDGGIGH